MTATAHGRCRVLLVEDEALICEMLADALAERGFEVHAVADGTNALRHLTKGEPCDVLFTDINLLGEIDGAELLATRPVAAAGVAGDLRFGGRAPH